MVKYAKKSLAFQRHAGGLPIGAVLLKQRVADVMAPGDHGSTFAGNPLVCSVANAVFDVVNEPTFLSEVERKGEYLREQLRRLLADNSHVQVCPGHVQSQTACFRAVLQVQGCVSNAATVHVDTSVSAIFMAWSGQIDAGCLVHVRLSACRRSGDLA